MTRQQPRPTLNPPQKLGPVEPLHLAQCQRPPQAEVLGRHKNKGQKHHKGAR